MSYRKSFGAAYHDGGGRMSPYQSSAYLAKDSDRSLSDLYSYVDADDPSHTRNSSSHQGHFANSLGTANSFPVFEDEDAPDVLYIRFQGEVWPFGYPPFSIAEEKVLVKHVRDRVAEKLGVSDRRVRLVYKDHALRRNHVPLRDYGCKQNSEISAIVTTESRDHDNYKGGSDSESGSAVSRNRGSDDEQHHSHRKQRHQSSSRTHHDDPRSAHPSSNGMLHPHHASGPTRETREPREPREPRDYPSRPSQLANGQSDSPVHGSSGRGSPKSNGPSPRTSAQSVSTPAPTADPTTPLGKVQSMRHELHSKWIPEIEAFLKSPPTDTDERTKEYRRLSEILFKRVWEVGDMVDPSADEKNKEEIRAVRKQSYAEAQSLVGRLDVYKA